MSQLSPALLRVLAMLAAQEEATASGQPQAAQAELDAIADADDQEVTQVLQSLPQEVGEGEGAPGPSDRVTTPTLIKLEQEGAAFATKPSDWKPYKGAGGGQGWENVHTGRVEYVKDRPGREPQPKPPEEGKVPKAPPGPAPQARAAAGAAPPAPQAPTPPQPAPKPTPEASTLPPAEAAKQGRLKELQRAQQQELALPDHPMKRLRHQLAPVQFGQLPPVKTIRGVEGSPLSAADHERMANFHAHTGGVMGLLGHAQESQAHLAASRMHRAAAEAKRPKAPDDPDVVRRTLETGRVKEVSALGKSANKTAKLTFEDGTAGVFKPASGEKKYLRQGAAGGTYHRREVAAYRLASLIGMGDLVPLTTTRTEEGEAGSIQHFVAGAREAFALPQGSEFDGPEHAARAAVFDYITGNMDRHQGNWLVGQDGRIHLIDNGLSFPTGYHEYDFVGVELRKHALEEGLKVPDLSALRGRWREVEKVLEDSGLEPDAVALTYRRFDQAVRASGKSFAALPDDMKSYGLSGVAPRAAPPSGPTRREV